MAGFFFACKILFHFIVILIKKKFLDIYVDINQIRLFFLLTYVTPFTAFPVVSCSFFCYCFHGLCNFFVLSFQCCVIVSVLVWVHVCVVVVVL